MLARALVMEKFNEPMVERKIPIPNLDVGQLLIKIEVAGVCGSDVHIWHGKDPRVKLPMILGHEGIGIVAAIGRRKYTVDGEEVKEGDRLLWNRGISCGSCYYCVVLKEPSLCPYRKVQGINVSAAESPYLNGCFADYIILAAGTDVFKVPQDIAPSTLVAASCSGATAAHGFDLAHPEPGETVVVLGPGPLGLFAVVFARSYGASQIILSGGTQVRLEVGKAFGATTIFNREEIQEQERYIQVMDLTKGRGADLVIEAAGTIEALQEAIKLARVGGTVLSLGLAVPVETFPFDGYHDLVRKNLRLQGVWVSDTRHTFRALKLILEQPQLFRRMVTHQLALEQANEAFGIIESKEGIKVVLLPGKV